MGRIAAAACGVLLLVGCPPKTYSGKDAEMMAAAKAISKAIDAYQGDYAAWPESLEQVKPYLPEWPVDPYHGNPIVDTGSAEFDAATSSGMVYYQKLYRDEQLVNYQLHVFREHGKLYIIGNSALGLKE